MSAKRDVQVAAKYITPRSLLIFALIVLVAFAYCEGKRSERQKFDAKQAVITGRLLIDSSKEAHDSENVRGVELLERRDDMKHDRVAHAKAASRLVPVGENAIRVDGGEPQSVVPANLVIPELRTAQEALVSDSLALVAAMGALGFATTRADMNERRAELAESQVAKSKPSRWRFVGGFVVGVASIILLRKALK